MDQPFRILFVEGEPADQELAEQSMRSEGLAFTSMRVDAREDFLRALETFQPDLILSDHLMPGFDGMQVLRLVQEKSPDVPVIILIDLINKVTAVECMRAGADNYVFKDYLQRLPFAVKDAILRRKLRAEKAEAERNQRESEDIYRALFQNNHAVMLLISPSTGRIIDANPAACAYYGWSHEEITRMRITQINTLTEEEIKQEMHNAVTQRRNHFQFRHRLANGEIRDVEVYSGPIQHQGQTLLYSIVHDVTPQKQAEAQQRLQAAALNAAASAISISDRQGIIRWVNPAFARLSGYSEEELLGQSTRLLLPPSPEEVVNFIQLWEVLSQGKVWRGEIVHQRKDGTLYVVEESVTPLIDSNGQVEYLIGIQEDITERKRAELALRRKTDLQEVIASLGRELTGRLDFAGIYQAVWQHLQRIIDCEDFRITLLDERKSTLQTVFAVQRGVPLPSERLHQRLSRSSALDGRWKAVTEKKPFLIFTAQQISSPGEEAASGLTAGTGFQSALFVPILVAGEALGLLEFRSLQKDAYHPEDDDWLSLVASQVGMAVHSARLFEQTQQRVSELQVLHQIDLAITTNLESATTYQQALKEIVTQPYVDAANLLVFRPDSNLLTRETAVGFHSPNLPEVNLHPGEGLAGKVAADRNFLLISSPAEEIPGIPRDPLWDQEGFAAYLGLPLILRGELKGVLELFSRKVIPADMTWLNFMQALARQIAIAVENVQLYHNLQQANEQLLQAYDATIAGWSQAMELRDRETEGHTERVTRLTLQIARALGIRGEKLVHIQRGALLHDIGKLGVPDHVLNKAGPLTDEEWAIMKKHPVFAYEMLSPIEYLRPALPIPYCHHEKWDGTGYPRGLRGYQIPLEARIFSIVDVYDALTSDRPYRKAWDVERALAYIQELSGKQFDPKIVAAFLAIHTRSNF